MKIYKKLSIQNAHERKLQPNAVQSWDGVLMIFSVMMIFTSGFFGILLVARMIKGVL